MSERIGIFGGTFDPPHVGHLALAERARERLRLDRVLFVPAAASPHKVGARASAARHRLAMTRLAVRGQRAFRVSALELGRPGPSYTIDTLRTLAARHPGARLFLLLGADSWATFAMWRESRAIRALATVAVATRPGAARPGRGGGRAVAIGNPPLAVSSSDLRRRAARGASLRYLVPDAVVRYVARHRLYRSRA